MPLVLPMRAIILPTSMMFVLILEPRDGDFRFTELRFRRQDEEVHLFRCRNRIRELGL